MNKPVWDDSKEGTTEIKSFDNIYHFTEQTTCPKCGNRDDNIVLSRSPDHHHIICGKCFLVYIVTFSFLGPFDYHTTNKNALIDLEQLKSDMESAGYEHSDDMDGFSDHLLAALEKQGVEEKLVKLFEEEK